MKKADSAARKRENASEYRRIVRGEEDDFYAIDETREYYRRHARQMVGFAATLMQKGESPAPAENQQASDTARAQKIAAATRSLIGKLQESHRAEETEKLRAEEPEIARRDEEKSAENLRREQEEKQLEILRRERDALQEEYSAAWDEADRDCTSAPVYPKRLDELNAFFAKK